jgi:hypothetical protein
LKKSKLTRKEIEKAIDGLSVNDQILNNKIVQIENVLSLYLQYRKDTDKFNKFVKAKVKEFEKQRSETGNKEGA